ncbi:hypothetical protein [Cutibacterium phage PAVL34]|nr:hypothetical protein [Cutibacterium phage PAVL34]
MRFLHPLLGLACGLSAVRLAVTVLRLPGGLSFRLCAVGRFWGSIQCWLWWPVGRVVRRVADCRLGLA